MGLIHYTDHHGQSIADGATTPSHYRLAVVWRKTGCVRSLVEVPGHETVPVFDYDHMSGLISECPFIHQGHGGDSWGRQEVTSTIALTILDRSVEVFEEAMAASAYYAERVQWGASGGMSKARRDAAEGMKGAKEGRSFPEFVNLCDTGWIGTEGAYQYNYRPYHLYETNYPMALVSAAKAGVAIEWLDPPTPGMRYGSYPCWRWCTPERAREVAIMPLSEGDFRERIQRVRAAIVARP